jgi:hypothetical protein
MSVAIGSPRVARLHLPDGDHERPGCARSTRRRARSAARCVPDAWSMRSEGHESPVGVFASMDDDGGEMLPFGIGLGTVELERVGNAESAGGEHASDQAMARRSLSASRFLLAAATSQARRCEILAARACRQAAYLSHDRPAIGMTRVLSCSRCLEDTPLAARSKAPIILLNGRCARRASGAPLAGACVPRCPAARRWPARRGPARAPADPLRARSSTAPAPAPIRHRRALPA